MSALARAVNDVVRGQYDVVTPVFPARPEVVKLPSSVLHSTPPAHARPRSAKKEVNDDDAHSQLDRLIPRVRLGNWRQVVRWLSGDYLWIP
jgi:hypothetical protein